MRNHHRRIRHRNATILLAAALGLLAAPSVSSAVDVKTVPWVAANPLIPHDTWSGNPVTLKGTADVQGAGIQYSWDFGDGSPPAAGTVSNRYVVEAVHAYAGSPGQIFTARLTVTDTGTGDSASQTYFVAIQNQTLGVEVNVAIDEGLWYLHKTQRRFVSSGQDVGDWTSGYAASSWVSTYSANVTAFEVNGHLASGDPANPYTETVARGLRRIFEYLTPRGIGVQTNGLGSFNPDGNGNGQGIGIGQGNEFYQGGMVIDALVASGTPGEVTVTGPSGVVGQTYATIVQDMVDYYAYCQYDGGTGGGWRYSCNQGPDNSAAQWAAIGLIPAEREWGLVLPQIVKDWNRVWIAYSHDSRNGWTTGRCGYTSAGYYPWGTFAVTPSCMVQMAMDGIGRGASTWDQTETYIRDNFTGLYGYYYGMFSFTKSMLLHDSDGDLVEEPIQMLHSQTAGVADLDWYGGEASMGDPLDGVARVLVNGQSAGGYWWSHNLSSGQYPFETAWAIIMLNRTVFSSGVPVAVAEAVPNPGVVGQTITLDGSGAFHQNPNLIIDSWDWDLDDDGDCDDASGPVVTTSYGALGNYNVTLCVTDDDDPEKSDQTTIVVLITVPPIEPTADADGPYAFCPQTQPWFLDGTGSVNPDEGVGEPGQPGDTIQEYAWELDGNASFNDALGPQPDVTALFTALGPGDYLIQLRVTDTTATSFPSSGMGDLSDTDSTEVRVRAGTDEACGCVDDLQTASGIDQITLSWTDTGAAGYNVYRATTSGGPYSFIGSTTDSSYVDSDVIGGITYYYVVREAALSGVDLCQSNEATGEASGELHVAIDIKPGSCPNSFNRNSNGVLPVAIVGTEELDVTQIDWATVEICSLDNDGDGQLDGCIGPHEGPPGPHTVLEDVATPFGGLACNCDELGGDGILDLSLKFKTAELVPALRLDELPSGDLPELLVRGALFDGTPIEGSDCVRLVPPGSPPGLAKLKTKNAPGAWVEISPLDNQSARQSARRRRLCPLRALLPAVDPDDGEGGGATQGPGLRRLAGGRGSADSGDQHHAALRGGR
jgi:hypothetical protein